MRPTLLCSIIYPLPPFQWPQNIWPWMTLTGYLALNSVFPPVRLADTGRLRKIIAWKLIKIDTYCQRCKSWAGTLISSDIRFVRISGRVLQQRDVKGQWGRSRVNARLALCANISKTVRPYEIRPKLLLVTNRKLHMRFRLAPRLMTLDETLDDLELAELL